MADKSVLIRTSDNVGVAPLNAQYRDIGGGLHAESVVAPLAVADADITQIVTVTSAGTPVQGPNKESPTGWWIEANPANVGTISFMFHGQTAAAKGFPLSPDRIIYLNVLNLSSIDVDGATNGNKAHFFKA